MELDIFEMVLLDEVDEMGVNVYSLVQSPANDTESVFLSKEVESVTLAMDESKQMIYSVALVPNQLILRNNEKGKYNIVFKEETIRLASQKAYGLSKFNFDHSNKTVEGLNTDGLKATESWLVENVELDKSKAIGLNAPKGSWVLGFHVEEVAMFNQIKDSGLTGLSIEGMFAREKVSLKSEEPIDVLLRVLKS